MEGPQIGEDIPLLTNDLVKKGSSGNLDRPPAPLSTNCAGDPNIKFPHYAGNRIWATAPCADWEYTKEESSDFPTRGHGNSVGLQCFA